GQQQVDPRLHPLGRHGQLCLRPALHPAAEPAEPDRRAVLHPRLRLALRQHRAGPRGDPDLQREVLMPAGRQATCRPRPMETPPASATPPAFDAQALAGLLKDAPEQAFAEVARLARAGTVAAQTLLVQMLVEGRGAARDPEAAVLWYQVAANNGDALAMNMLGRCHELGEGTPANPALAAVWYRRAAGLGLDWGMYNLANLMATGRGLPRDEAGAYALYARA